MDNLGFYFCTFCTLFLLVMITLCSPKEQQGSGNTLTKFQGGSTFQEARSDRLETVEPDHLNH